MREDLSERTDRYLKSTSAALKRLKIIGIQDSVSQTKLDHVLELVKDYVNDARHYAEKQKPVTSLACVAYAEGLLDALKFLELVDF